MRTMASWRRRAVTPFVSEYGHFRLVAYDFPDGAAHAALVSGHPDQDPRPLVRVQSACLTGTAFGAVLCDCRQQMQLALRRIVQSGSGCALYLDQEGRGHGLVEKVAQLNEMATSGVDTKLAAELHNVQPDVRDYWQAAAIMDDVLGGLRPLRLMTNNPTKVAGLIVAGVEVAEVVPIESEPTDSNREYLRAKRDIMGHRLRSL